MRSFEFMRTSFLARAVAAIFFLFIEHGRQAEPRHAQSLDDAISGFVVTRGYNSPSV